ncbi:MAG: ATP F0F1 synthase subunit B [Phenylobacterium sp.]|nr:MAG: ATP F0F1 synthase subunit B [Phenylobacterium sp.]
MTELFSDAHFWIGLAFLIFVIVLVLTGVPKLLLGMLDSKAQQVQSQLDEANALRQEAEWLLAEISDQRVRSEKHAAEILANAQEEAKRLQVEAQAKLVETIQRRGQLAERRIATAEAQAAAQVKSAAADLAAQMAEDVLKSRLAGATSDPLIDQALGQLAGKLQ